MHFNFTFPFQFLLLYSYNFSCALNTLFSTWGKVNKIRRLCCRRIDCYCFSSAFSKWWLRNMEIKSNILNERKLLCPQANILISDADYSKFLFMCNITVKAEYFFSGYGNGKVMKLKLLNFQGFEYVVAKP